MWFFYMTVLLWGAARWLGCFVMGPYVIGSFCAGLSCDGSFCDGTLCRSTEFTGYVLDRFSFFRASVSYQYLISEYLKLITLQTKILIKIPARERNQTRALHLCYHRATPDLDAGELLLWSLVEELENLLLVLREVVVGGSLLLLLGVVHQRLPAASKSN